MSKCIFCLLCLACLLANLASASRNLASADNGRQLFHATRHLLQAPNSTDCSRSVKNCLSCRYQFFHGTVAKAICLSCDAGYVVKNGGRSCWCAPGYYQDPADATGDTCTQCGYGAYCVGAKATKASGAARVPCGLNKKTNTEYAMFDRECLAKPGYGWATGNGSSVCPVGYYNPGNNNRKCTRCPGSLTTTENMTISSQGCVAPAGHYYLRGRAVACARGTWKSETGNADCNLCPEGFTTPLGVVGNQQTAGKDCNFLMPGYEASPGLIVGSDAAVMCPEGTYRVTEQTYDGSTAVDCISCPDGMGTLPNVTAATSPDACLVLPGHGWVAGASPGTAVGCSVGQYNTGWNREPCKGCGLGTIATDAANSTSPDDCKVPVGHGTNRSADGLTLMGFQCPMDTYGRPNDTYGLVDVECTKCPENTHTNSTAATSNLDCLTDPGYGWYDGQVLQCAYATYNPGENHNPCALCKEGYNTSTVGKTALADCQVAAGWLSDGSSGVEPCLRGYFKDWLGTNPNVCTQCPNGTTTIVTMAATEQSDCDACRPGHGKTLIHLESPECTICGSGYYSPGYVKYGADCTICPNPYNFTGLMVSRKVYEVACFGHDSLLESGWPRFLAACQPVRGISTPEDCVGEFPTNAVMENDQEWDIIWINKSLAVQATKTTLADCQAGCSNQAPANNTKCQYFEWHEWRASGSQCYYKMAAVAIEDPGDLSTDADYMLFEVSAGQYAAYLPGTDENIDFVGETLDATSYTTRAASVDACNSQAACIGITHKAGSGIWRQFKGTKWEGAVGKVKVVGETINPWIATPSSAPNRH